MNKKFYIKDVTGESQATVNSGTSVATNGSILYDRKSSTPSVGIYKTSGTGYYLGSGTGKALVEKNGVVFTSDRNRVFPDYNTMNSKITNSNAKAVFNKFFNSNHKAGTTTPTVSNWGSSSNLNAFAYMNSNLWSAIDSNKPTAN